MKAFTDLHTDLLSIPDRRTRIERLESHFSSINDEQTRRWTEYLLLNKPQSRFMSYNKLRGFASEFMRFPPWLTEECIRHTGNVVDAISLIVGCPNTDDSITLVDVMEFIAGSETLTENGRKEFIFNTWERLSSRPLFLFNRLITGIYRPPLTDRDISFNISPERANYPSPSDDFHRLHRIKAVLLYVSRAEYTFAVWNDELLIPVVKITDGLTPDERLRIRQYARRNTRELFGPVSSVDPRMVYEIGFERVERNKRRKSGICLTSPRIIGYCPQALPEEADRLSAILGLLE